MASPQAVSAMALGNEELEHCVQTIGRSEHRLQIFREIYSGKRDPKTVSFLIEQTGFNPTDVHRAGRALAQAHMVEQVKVGDGRGETAYKKTPFCVRNRDKILKHVENPDKLAELETIRRPRGAAKSERVSLPTKRIQAREITVDDIDSFKKVAKVRSSMSMLAGLSETAFKNGVAKVVGEAAKFRDWGGEKSDLMTTRVRLKGRRIACAFAFKGPGQPGKLVPGRMGKNGDQCQRLFQEPAELFVVHHWREIDSSVRELVATHAKLKSYVEGKPIYYCLIDGQDSDRLVKAYPSKFKRAGSKSAV